MFISKEKRNISIIHELLAGKSVKEVAKNYDVSIAVVRRVKNKGFAAAVKSKEKKFNPSDPMVRSDAVRIIKSHRSKPFTLDFLASKLKTTVDDAKRVITHLSHHDGYNLVSIGDRWQLLDTLPPAEPLKLKRLVGKEYVFGVVADAHMVNKHHRLDVLEAAYDVFQERGIKTVLNAGNIIDGEFRFNKYELKCIGAHNQSQYVADNHPQRKGITTYFITGDCHEGWYQSREGIKIGWYIQKVCEDNGRNDLKWIGHIESDIILEQQIGKTRIRVMHPGGGTPYALSYPSQKMVESFQGGEKPHILIMGHFHKFDFNYQREVACIMPGCIEDQTPFMRKKKLAAHVGFCILTIGARLDGTTGHIKVEWFPFYDRKYHQRLNQYGGELIIKSKK